MKTGLGYNKGQRPYKKEYLGVIRSNTGNPEMSVQWNSHSRGTSKPYWTAGGYENYRERKK